MSLVYKSAADFFVLHIDVSCDITEFIYHLHSFLVGSAYKACLEWAEILWISLLLVVCLLLLSRTYWLSRIRTVLHWRRVLRVHFHIWFHMLEDTLSEFPPLNRLLIMGVSFIAFALLRYTPSIPNLFVRVLVLNGFWTLESFFKVSVQVIVWFYPFCIDVISYVHGFAHPDPSLHPWDKPIWSWWMIFLNEVLELRALHLCSWVILMYIFLFLLYLWFWNQGSSIGLIE